MRRRNKLNKNKKILKMKMKRIVPVRLVTKYLMNNKLNKIILIIGRKGVKVKQEMCMNQTVNIILRIFGGKVCLQISQVQHPNCSNEKPLAHTIKVSSSTENRSLAKKAEQVLAQMKVNVLSKKLVGILISFGNPRSEVKFTLQDHRWNSKVKEPRQAAPLKKTPF